MESGGGSPASTLPNLEGVIRWLRPLVLPGRPDVNSVAFQPFVSAASIQTRPVLRMLRPCKRGKNRGQSHSRYPRPVATETHQQA